MTKVFITGISGFVGSNVAIKLVKEGYSVDGLVRQVSSRELAFLEPVLDKIHLIKGDITSYHSVNSAIGSSLPQYVLHLGALTPVRLSFEDPFPFVETNFKGTVNVVHTMLEKTPKAQLVLASTAEVYGWQEKQKPIKETAPLNPFSPYAVSKEAADQYVRMAMKIYGLKATILRPINTYGRRVGGFIVEYLIDSMINGKTCYVGAPDSVRDYMFVSDQIQAYKLAIESEEAIGNVFNVSPGNPATNQELTNMIAEITKFKGQTVFGSYPPGYPLRPTKWDPKYLVLDSTKIRRLLGWKPTLTLKEGLEKVMDMWKER